MELRPEADIWPLQMIHKSVQYSVAPVYQADFLRPIHAMHIAVDAAFYVSYLNSFTANAVASSLLH